jgi:hypothetical protein
MSTRTVNHRLLRFREDRIQWDESSPLTMNVETRLGQIHTRHGRFVGGLSDQVEVIEVVNDKLRVFILPTRGMSIWRIENDGVPIGWESPVSGPVHPAHVPVFDSTGIGWLEGFDELVVRCGLESNGAPEHDAQGRLVYPLHGRIGNLPAESLSIEYDEASGRLEVIGEVIEARLFIKRLRIRSRIRFHAGSSELALLDDVTNDLDQPATMQLLYHINVGAPILDEGTVLEAPIEILAPKDPLSAGEIDRWNQYGPPQRGYSERVYFARLRADDASLTTALLRTAEGDRGLGVTFNINGLPYFVLWKNTAGENDGYVTGLEPATNLPNQRSFEASQGRVVALQPGQTASFRVNLSPLNSREEVDRVATRIRELRGDHQPEILRAPKQGWSPEI